VLRKNKKLSNSLAKGRFAIVASKYNARFVGAMLRGAQRELRRAGATVVHTVRVPGAFEIPVAAAKLARTVERLDAILCLGVVIRGQTAHAKLIAESVTAAFAQLQLEREIPIIHEVLLLENLEQAKARCLDPQRNRGVEAAQTALEMARVMRSLEIPRRL